MVYFVELNIIELSVGHIGLDFEYPDVYFDLQRVQFIIIRFSVIVTIWQDSGIDRSIFYLYTAILSNCDDNWKFDYYRHLEIGAIVSGKWEDPGLLKVINVRIRVDSMLIGQDYAKYGEFFQVSVRIHVYSKLLLWGFGCTQCLLVRIMQNMVVFGP